MSKTPATPETDQAPAEEWECVVDLAAGLPAHLKARLAPLKKDPLTGWLEVEGFGARVGVQAYPERPWGEQRQYRPAEEVYSAESLASWAGRPFLVRHPQQRGDTLPLVTAQTAQAHTAGSVIGAYPERDLGLVRVRFLVTHPEGIAALEDPAGPRQLSAGYTRALDKTPGVTGSGEVYDSVQRGIRINHLSLVDEARAGEMARVRAAADAAAQGKERAMELVTIVVDGRPVRVAKEDAEILRMAAEAKGRMEADAKSRLEVVEAKLAQAEAKLLAAEADAKDAKGRAEKLELEQLQATIKGLLPELATEGLSAAALRGRVVEEAYPEAKDKGGAVVDALYPLAVKRLTEGLSESREQVRRELGAGAQKSEGATDTDGLTKARAQYLKAQGEAWKAKAI